MSTTVLEALQNAQINFGTLGKMGAKNSPFFVIAMEQLNNSITALENGKSPNDIIQENMFEDLNLTET